MDLSREHARPPGAGAQLALAPVLVAAFALLLAVVTLAVALGSVRLAPMEVWQVVLDHLRGERQGTVADQITWGLRLPRVVLAAVVGGALTTSGVVMQVLVRNPLAEPFLLGVSSGASVGATAVILFGVFGGLGLWAVSAGSILGSVVAMMAVFGLARTRGGLGSTQLILCGVVISALFQSMTSFLIFEGDPQATQGVLFWLLGSFGRANWDQLVVPTCALVVSVTFLVLQRRALNALALGDGVAASVGIDVPRFRRSLFAIASLTAGATVAVAGVVGFVGLVVPHIVRLVVGYDHRRVLPAGVLLGANFMVLADLLARTLVSPQEMPLGVISAFVGAPILLILIRRQPYFYGVSG
ncbi:MAG: iron ABC transporter permease [Methylobacteriaceae bacterium]|nr:iron ABC transporter permease [Methylobacteriaceae bacterium]